MIKKTYRELRKSERDYPGIIKDIRPYENAVLPVCPNCGSNHTATVIAGIIGRTICMVGSTTRIKLHPNRPFEGSYYCNDCTAYYEADGRFCFRKIPQPEPRPVQQERTYEEGVALCIQRLKELGIINETKVEG